jgi:uncharacterized protein
MKIQFLLLLKPTILVLVNLCLLPLPASAQQMDLIWKVGGNEVGATTYRSKADGTFESVTEIKIAGSAAKSRVAGKISGGALVEYEALNNIQGRKEVKISARDGKAHITTNNETKDVDYTPSKILFSNYHPVFWDTIIKALNPAKEGTQTIEIFILESAENVKIEVLKKEARTVESGGKRLIADVYLLRFGSAEEIGLYVGSAEEIDLYLTDRMQFAAWVVPSQKVEVVRAGLLVDPTILYPELSQPVMKAKTEKGAKVKMRDGVELAADISRPADEGKYPAILVRTPYGRQRMTVFEGEWWARRGYVYIAQDVRGRNDSDGEWNPFFNERKDGYDTIDWIIKQPWSDGKVGMTGGSYDGWVQWAAAAEAHPALKCIVPEVSPPDLFFDVTHDHGVPHLYGYLMWVNFVREKKPSHTSKPIKVEKLKSLPLSRIDDEVFGQSLPFYDRGLEMETYSAFAGANFMPDMKKIKIPILHISGWWDGEGIGAKLNWATMRTLGHQDQWLIYGPWGHSVNTSSRVRGVDYGPNAVIEMDSIYLRWFDQWLKGKPVKWREQPKARIFVTGANEWRALEDWPDPRSKQMSLYLSSQGPANSSASVGELRNEPPKEEEPDRYTYNPAGVEIPEEIEESADIVLRESALVRIKSSDQDVLVYKTAPMTESLEIGGPIELDLYFSTSARDTDFFAYLVDIDEQNVMRAIGLPGKIRAKYLNGWDQPTLLVPDKVYLATIALRDTAHQFKKGRRLGVVIQSQMFPSYARNLNTGEPIKSATRMVAAHQTIYHDAKRPSRLRVYLLPTAEK